MIPKLHLKIVERFREIFGHKGEAKLYFAPGKVTVIGELIDYSGGNTITAAIDRGTYIVARKRPDSKVNIYAHSFKARKSFSLDDLEKTKEDEWLVYFKGVYSSLIEKDYKVAGIDIYVYTDLPFNTSLASSSSLCACLTYAILDLNGLSNIEPIEKAKLSYEGEKKFASQKTSLTDHATIFMGKENQVFFFNMNSLEYEYLDFNLGEYCMAVINSNKKRNSSDSEYNARRRECDNAFKKLKEKDFDFYAKAKYGDSVDVELLFNSRLKNGLLVIFLLIFAFITDLTYVKILFSLIAGYGAYKLNYLKLRKYYKTHLHEIDIMLPYYLKNLEILVQHYI